MTEENYKFGNFRIMTHEDIEESKILNEVYTKLPEYQQRMIDEYSDLIKRHSKLGEFMTPNNATWKDLNYEEQRDMWLQLHAMTIYKMALRSRLERAHIAEIFFPLPDCAG